MHVVLRGLPVFDVERVGDAACLLCTAKAGHAAARCCEFSHGEPAFLHKEGGMKGSFYLLYVLWTLLSVPIGIDFTSLMIMG
jgi:hypothetical protein